VPEYRQKEQEAWALNNLGVTYLRMGDMAKALDAHQTSLSIRREAGLRQQQGRSLYQIAAVLVAQGHWRQADKHLRDSEATARETGIRSACPTLCSCAGSGTRVRVSWKRRLMLTTSPWRCAVLSAVRP